MGGDGGCDGFFEAVPLILSCAFRFLPAVGASSGAPMIGSVGPSLEYGGLAVTVVVLASFSADDANISLMRFALPMFNSERRAIVEGCAVNARLR